MKKMLLGSIVLCLFSISVLLVQISCSKTNAQLPSPPSAQSTPNAQAQVSKIIFTKDIPASPDKEIWTSDYDGSNAVQIPITYPAGLTWTQSDEHAGLSISPDGQKIFLVLSPLVNQGTGAIFEIYSCDITGGTPALVVPGKAGKVQAY